MSGPEAVGIAESVFRPGRGAGLRPQETHRLLYGHVARSARWPGCRRGPACCHAGSSLVHPGGRGRGPLPRRRRGAAGGTAACSCILGPGLPSRESSPSGRSSTGGSTWPRPRAWPRSCRRAAQGRCGRRCGNWRAGSPRGCRAVRASLGRLAGSDRGDRRLLRRGRRRPGLGGLGDGLLTARKDLERLLRTAFRRPGAGARGPHRHRRQAERGQEFLAERASHARAGDRVGYPGYDA